VRTGAGLLAWAVAALFVPPASALAPEGGTPPAPAPAPAPPPAPGDKPAEDAPVDPVGEAKRLHDEGKELFKTAADTDLNRDDRKKARQESMKKLKRAKKLIEDWIEGHPGDAGSLAEIDSDINITMFWLRKEGGVGEFETGAPRPTAPVPPGPVPPGPGPAGPAGPDPGTPAGPSPGTAAGPSPPPPPKPPTAPEELAGIREYEKAHPGDVPGLHERYSQFLTLFPDPSKPEYEAAVRRVDELGRQLKDVYRKARDEDPDALAGADPAEMERLVDQLSPDLKSPEPAVRRRAARFLGGLGSGKAAQALVDALLAEKDSDTLDAIKEALAKIGGRRVCDRLAKEKPGGPTGESVVDVYLRMVNHGGVNARIAGEAVAGFVKTLDETTRGLAADGLFQAGRDGAVGLALLVDLVPVEKKVGFIEFLGKAGEPRAAGNLAHFLTVNPQGARRTQFQAAMEAIRTLGKPAVRWLIPALDDPTCQVHTAELLKEITGAKPKDDKRKTWEEWFRKNRKAVEGK
jgi:hypothetical protein